MSFFNYVSPEGERYMINKENISLVQKIGHQFVELIYNSGKVIPLIFDSEHERDYFYENEVVVV